jgi:hypothetical protein
MHGIGTKISATPGGPMPSREMDMARAQAEAQRLRAGKLAGDVPAGSGAPPPADMQARVAAARQRVQPLGVKPPAPPSGMPQAPMAPPSGMAGGAFGMARPQGMGGMAKAPMMTGRSPAFNAGASGMKRGGSR